MSDVFFIDLFNHLINQLKLTTQSLKVAVAWINFDIFYPVFSELRQKGVSIDIIVDDNRINQKYINIVEDLREQGIFVSFLKMPFYSTMHEKFCIIDNKYVLFGSYNWTTNATNNNFENLFYTDDPFIVEKFIFEFFEIQNITYPQIFALQKSFHNYSYNPCFNICTIVQENDNVSRLSIFKTIGNEFDDDAIFEEFYEIGLYINLVSIHEKIFDCDDLNGNTKQSMYDFELHKFIIKHVLPLVGNIPVHALAVKRYELYHRNIEDIYYNIIWKNRFIANFINDRYEL